MSFSQKNTPDSCDVKIENNNINKPLIRLICFALTILIVCSFFTIPVSAAKGYQNNKIVIAEEPDNISDSVEYYVNGKKQDKSKMVWSEDGFTGKALSLSGNGEYLTVGAEFRRIDDFSISGHIKWRGAKEGLSRELIVAEKKDDDSGEVEYLPSLAEQNERKQRIFNLYQDNRNKIQIQGYPSTTFEKLNRLNGYYFSVKRDPSISEFYEKVTDESNFGFTKNKWQHFALVFDRENVVLYIDGKLVDRKHEGRTFIEYLTDFARIGDGEDDDSTLNALIDNFAMYKIPLSSEQVARLAVGIDTSDTKTPIPTVDNPLPTAPVTTDSGETVPTVPDVLQGLFSDIPTWVYRLAIVILIIFFALSILLAIYKPPAPKRKPKKSKKTKNNKHNVVEDTTETSNTEEK